jgi:hypothetical protein
MMHTKEIFLDNAEDIFCGENLFIKSNKDQLKKVKNGSEPFKDWYDEIAYYDYATNGTINNTVEVGKVLSTCFSIGADV